MKCIIGSTDYGKITYFGSVNNKPTVTIKSFKEKIYLVYYISSCIKLLEEEIMMLILAN